MRRILVTGSSGYIGRRIAAAFGRAAWATVIPMDIAAAAPHCHDVRAPLDGVLRDASIDTVVHAAFVLGPTRDWRRMRDVNIDGTRNVAAACARNGVRQLVFLSSATVYGFHADAPAEYGEEAPPRPHANFAYGLQKQQMEAELTALAARTDGLCLSILRPSTILSAGAHNAFARYLTGRIVPVPYPAARMQFTHADDLANIVQRVVEQRLAGVYNVGAAGTVSLAESAAILRRPILPLPFPVLRGATALTWKSRIPGLSMAESGACWMLRYPWVVSSAKVREATGYVFRHTSLGALQEFAAAVR